MYFTYLKHLLKNREEKLNLLNPRRGPSSLFHLLIKKEQMKRIYWFVGRTYNGIGQDNEWGLQMGR